MATIQKSITGYVIKLDKPVTLKFKGKLSSKVFTKNGFTKYIHRLGQEEEDEITKVEKDLGKYLKRVSKKLGQKFMQQSAVTEIVDVVAGAIDGVDNCVYLTVPKDSQSKLKSVTKTDINIKMIIRGLNLTESGKAYLSFSSEFEVVESKADRIESDDDADDESDETPEPED